VKQLLGWSLRIFFHLLYHQCAWSYDWVAAGVSLGKWNDWVKQVLPYIQAGRILELGYGPGHLQLELLKRGLITFGLDASPQMSRQAMRRLQKRGFRPNLLRGFAQTLPFRKDTFQYIVSTFPSEYIVDPLTLSEIERVLEPGGQAIILALAWINGTKWPEKAAGGLFRVTGQSPKWEDRFLEPVTNAGFQARVDWVDLDSSRIAIIVAQKKRKKSF
jgi:ubiquinone/menaquinone biosynthesis C-methylase UbiE